MLKRTLILCSLTLCGFIGLQAMEQETPSSSPIEINNDQGKQEDSLACDEEEKDLTPGVLICDGKGDNCTQDKEEAPAAILFSVFCEDEQQDEGQILACKDCQ